MLNSLLSVAIDIWQAVQAGNETSVETIPEGYHPGKQHDQELRGLKEPWIVKTTRTVGVDVGIWEENLEARISQVASVERAECHERAVAPDLMKSTTVVWFANHRVQGIDCMKRSSLIGSSGTVASRFPKPDYSSGFKLFATTGGLKIERGCVHVMRKIVRRFLKANCF